MSRGREVIDRKHRNNRVTYKTRPSERERERETERERDREREREGGTDFFLIMVEMKKEQDNHFIIFAIRIKNS